MYMQETVSVNNRIRTSQHKENSVRPGEEVLRKNGG